MPMTEYELRAEQIGVKIGRQDSDQLLQKAANPAAHITVIADENHHVGDDTGRLMCDAYAEGGAAAAVDVLLAYLDAYNAQRHMNGMPLIAAETIRDTLGWAASVRANRAQIDEMREEFITRKGIERRADGYPDDGADPA